MKCNIRIAGTESFLCSFWGQETILVTERKVGSDCYRTEFTLETANRLIDYIANTNPNFDVFDAKKGMFRINVYTHQELKEQTLLIEEIKGQVSLF